MIGLRGNIRYIEVKSKSDMSISAILEPWKLGPVLPRCLEGAMVVSPLPILIFLVAFCIGYYKNRNEEAVDNTIIVERVVEENSVISGKCSSNKCSTSCIHFVIYRRISH